MKISTAIPPQYRAIAKVAACAVVLLAAGFIGSRVQRAIDGAVIEQARGALRVAKSELKGSAASLRGAAAGVRAQNKAAADALAMSEAARLLAQAAGEIAEKAASAADRRAANYRKQLMNAAARKPACADLLSIDVEAVCGMRSP